MLGGPALVCCRLAAQACLFKVHEASQLQSCAFCCKPHQGATLWCHWQVQPNHLLVRYDSLHVVHPLDDAFTMSFKAVLRHACQHGHTHSRCHHFRHHKG